jgi:hypothetical protein
VLDRKGSEAPQLDTVALGHGAGDFSEDGVDDILDVALIEMRVLGGNSLDKL